MRSGVWVFVFLVSLPLAARAETETLAEAWVEAYQINPSLQAERAKLRATDEQVSQALSHWRPSADATANVGKTYQYLPEQAPLANPNFDATTRGYGVQVTQPLFRGFRTLSETESAKKQVMSGRAQLEGAEEQLFIDTATAYLNILRDQAVVDANRDTENVLVERLDETKARLKAGDLTQTDVHQAESRLARARVARYQAENSLTQDRASYMRLVGKAPEKLQQPELALDAPKELDEALHLAETRNPNVIAAQYAMDSADADIDLAKGSLLPEIDLVGNASRNWGQNSTLPGQIDSSQILVQLTMPLYRSGTDYSKARAAEQTKTQRRMEMEEARHKAHETADNAWQALQTAEAAVTADKDEVDAAEEALKGVREESKIGTRTTLDVLNAEQELLDAKTDLAKSQHDRDLAILQIKSAVGDLTADRLKLPVDRYDPGRHYDDVRGQWVGFSADDKNYKVSPAKETVSE
jgi:TolC family type I secretion outer membrane protein